MRGTLSLGGESSLYIILSFYELQGFLFFNFFTPTAPELQFQDFVYPFSFDDTDTQCERVRARSMKEYKYTARKASWQLRVLDA